MANKTIVDLETDLVKPYIDKVKKNAYLNGTKNLLPMKLARGLSGVDYGITSIVNEDGSIQISGTNSYSNSRSFALFDYGWVYGANSGGSKLLVDDYLERNVDYVVHVSDSDTNAHIRMTFFDESMSAISSLSINTGTHATFNINNASVKYFIIRISVAQGLTVPSGTVIYPMICLKSDYDMDNSWSPVVYNNKGLQASKVGWDSQKNFGSVNMIPNTAKTSVIRGITYTVNEDGSVDVSGTNDGTGNSNLAVVTNVGAYVPNGTYKIKGCPKGGSEDSYALYTRNAHNQLAFDTGDGVVTDLPWSETSSLNIRIASGYAIQGTLHFEPMICPSDYEGDYVPYAASNGQLMGRVETLENNLSLVKVSHSGGFSNSTKTITFSNNCRFILLGTQNTPGNSYDTFLVGVGLNNQAPNVHEIFKGSAVTVDASQTGKLVITNTGGGTLAFDVIVLNGGTLTIT